MGQCRFCGTRCANQDEAWETHLKESPRCAVLVARANAIRVDAGLFAQIAFCQDYEDSVEFPRMTVEECLFCERPMAAHDPRCEWPRPTVGDA